MIFFPEVTKEMVQEFMTKKENAELIVLIDKWFTKKTEERDLDGILCLIQAISIFCGIAAKEIIELQALLNDKGQKYDA